MNQVVYKERYQVGQYFLIALISIVMTLQSQGQPPVDSIKGALITAKADSTTVQLYIQLADAYKNEEDSSLYYAKKAIEVADNFTDSARIAKTIKAISALSYGFYRQRATKRILPYLFLAKDFSERKKNDRLTANTYNLLAMAYTYTGESNLALEAIEKTIAYRTQADTMSKALLDAYKIYCIVKDDLGDSKSAVEAAVKSLKYAEEQGMTRYIFTFRNLLSQMYNKQNDVNKGLYYAEQALKISIDSGMHVNQIISGHITISALYSSKSKEDTSDVLSQPLRIKHLKEAAGLALKYNNIEALSICYTNMGFYYQENNSNDSMRYYFEKALPILQQIGKERTKLSIYISLIKHHYEYAIMYKDSNDLSAYKEHLLKGKEYGERVFASNILTESMGLIHNSTLYLSWIYSELGDYENAYRFLSRHEAVEDSLYDADRLAVIEEMEGKYQTEKKDLEIENLNKEKALQKASNERQQMILYGGAFVLLLLVVFLAIVYRLYQQKQEINEDLGKQNNLIAEQNEEKEILLKEIHHRVKNNLQIISSLLSLQSRKMDNDQAIAAIEDGQNRVKSMALIHHKLYQNDDISVVNFKEYTMQLSDQILGLFKLSKIKVNLDIPSDVAFDIDTAIPLGLILNELLTNACKYAFQKEENKQLDIILTSHETGIYTLEVKDNGEGMPADFDLKKSKSLGLRLVQRLSMQLFGKTSYNSGAGAHFKIQFKDTFLRKEMD